MRVICGNQKHSRGGGEAELGGGEDGNIKAEQSGHKPH